MNKQKQTYLSPETETLVVRFEGCLCASPWSSASVQSMEEENDDLLF